jgi:NADH:ubiquinone oxidoreductase subunit K
MLTVVATAALTVAAAEVPVGKALVVYYKVYK